VKICRKGAKNAKEGQVKPDPAFAVMPAEAGIQHDPKPWIPAFAGMTT
jgi:hypothetical protein